MPKLDFEYYRQQISVVKVEQIPFFPSKSEALRIFKQLQGQQSSLSALRHYIPRYGVLYISGFNGHCKLVLSETDMDFEKPFADEPKGRFQGKRKVFHSEQALFPELFGEMIVVMDDSGQGYFDLLGEIFMIHISKGLNGQFFTPQPVTDLMARATCGAGIRFNKTVCDPACGSGRNLLSAAKIMGMGNFYFGADLDKNCAKMTAINLCLNNLRGEVAHMNSLSLELYSCYEVFYDPTRKFAPTIRIIENDKSVFYTNPEAFKKAVAVSSVSIGNAIKKQSMAAQLGLFD